jgi:exodeoxyribonuclease V alpha subunit
MSDAPLSAAQTLAEGFAAQAGRWAQARGAPAGAVRWVQRAAWRVSQALADGDVCVWLDDLAWEPGVPGAPLDPDPVRQALLASGVVGTPAAPGACPLVLDDDGRLYLHRYFDYEQRLARSLARRAAPGGADEPGPAARELLKSLFPARPDSGAPDWQQVGAAQALLGRLTVLSGGPGTGKTTTLVNLLACLLADQPDQRVALAAPTGKAAARMIEALRGRAGHLPADLRERMPSEAHTVHRLLGLNPATGRSRHHRGAPLPLDVLVVDEASMLDLALATRLLEAVPESARIVLLGDKDQLAAVESGAVFAEISADPGLSDARRRHLADLCGLSQAELVPPTGPEHRGLADCVVWLTRNFRFAEHSGIGQLARHINAGDVTGALGLLAGDQAGAVTWFRDAPPAAGQSGLAGAGGTARHETALCSGYEPYLSVLSRPRPGPAEAFAAFDRFRCLCALRQGPRGVDAVNRSVGQHLRRRLGQDPALGERSPWYPGRPVLIARNDYVLKLFNGDIGLTLADESGELQVWFPDGDGGYRPLAPLRLPAHETAFAMTIHKSQGSEFDRVMVLLPEEPNRVLTRELLYTGLTRARLGVDLVASETVLAQAIRSVTRRRSGLMARLRAFPSPVPGPE